MIVLGPSFYGDIWATLQSTLNFTYTMVDLSDFNTVHAFLFRLDRGMICLELTSEMELLMEL